MQHRPVVLLALALGWPVLAGCANTATQVDRQQIGVTAQAGVVIGRFGFATRRALRAQNFELTAVEVPGGRKWRIPFSPELVAEDGSSAAFLVNLPPGHFRLTAWRAAAPGREWGGEDTGLAIEVVAGKVSCLGGLYLPPRERSRVVLDGPEAPAAAEVRDECADLAELLRQRAPRLAEPPVVRLARSVARPAPSTRAGLGAGRF